MRSARVPIAAIGVSAIVLSGVWLEARQAAAPPSDVLRALLEEVKGLRAATEQMASAGPRVQLFTARLQLQETRINNMIRRLDTSEQARWTDINSRLDELEKLLSKR